MAETPIPSGDAADHLASAKTSKVAIEMKAVNKWYGQFHVLKDVDLTVSQGERIVICGPSGSGKSTLIRCINRLEEHQRGSIVVDGVELGGDFKNIERVRREVGMVFQQFNLFPHRTLLENTMLAPMLVRGIPREEAAKTGRALLGKVGLQGMDDRYPANLSGGQQQRAAIARALAMHPKVMLYDEPTSALDPELVDEVLHVMKELDAEGMTQVVVTHEMRFARDASDYIVFMEGGHIAEISGGDEMFTNPKDERTRRFLRRFL